MLICGLFLIPVWHLVAVRVAVLYQHGYLGRRTGVALVVYCPYRNGDVLTALLGCWRVPVEGPGAGPLCLERLVVNCKFDLGHGTVGVYSLPLDHLGTRERAVAVLGGLYCNSGQVVSGGAAYLHCEVNAYLLGVVLAVERAYGMCVVPLRKTIVNYNVFVLYIYTIYYIAITKYVS